MNWLLPFQTHIFVVILDTSFSFITNIQFSRKSCIFKIYILSLSITVILDYCSNITIISQACAYPSKVFLTGSQSVANNLNQSRKDNPAASANKWLGTKRDEVEIKEDLKDKELGE